MPDFHIVTLFPEFFTSPLKVGLLGKAAASGLIRFSFHNPRDYSDNRHRHVDDAPYGGGPGMVMQADPVARAVRTIDRSGRIVCLNPAGRPLTGKLAAELAGERDLTLICGRYEGIDARLGELLDHEVCEISTGETILNGGETAALAAIESIARFIPGFLGSQESTEQESFAENLLEYPQYTRPDKIDGVAVPKVLLGGNHAEIRKWRRSASLRRTLQTRPGLLAKARLSGEDAGELAKLPFTRIGRNLSFCLFHYPVRLEGRRTGISSLTNLDIHDIARISRSYGMKAFYVLTPLRDQLDLLRKIIGHWRNGPDRDRARALGVVRPVAGFEELEACAAELHGITPLFIATSAQWPDAKKTAPPLAPADILELCRFRPVVICLGTARGLAEEAMARCAGRLRPLRFLDDNHLSVRSAAAIIADRILGDFY